MTIKKIFLLIILTLGLLSPVLVLAQDKYGLETAANTAGIGKVDTGSGKLAISAKTVPGLIGDIVGVALGLIGLLFFILFLYAGILWMTALGNADKANKAKDIMEAAVIGLLIVLAAYAITRFVFTNLGVGGKSGQTTVTSACNQLGGMCTDADTIISQGCEEISGATDCTTYQKCCKSNLFSGGSAPLLCENGGNYCNPGYVCKGTTCVEVCGDTFAGAECVLSSFCSAGDLMGGGGSGTLCPGTMVCCKQSI